MIPILSHTQEEFSKKISSLFGKGKMHASLLYSKWMKEGKLEIENWAEKQALSLIQEMVQATDFSLPKLFKISNTEILPTTDSKIEMSQNKVVKFLLKLENGLETESVAIPMEFGTTLCISSQVGCQMGCAFCETGRMGLLKNLRADEIVA